jgi:hypothetical protein
VIGGAIGLAIATAAYKSYILPRLDEFITEEQRNMLLQSAESISLFPLPVQAQIRGILAGGYNLQFKILIGFAGAQIPSSLLMWQKKQIIV